MLETRRQKVDCSVQDNSMNSRSEAVLMLREGADTSVLRRELQGMHLQLEPMFPGASTPTDQRWYVLIAEPGTSDNELDAILQKIRGISGVNAAYRKPPGEPPQESPP